MQELITPQHKILRLDQLYGKSTSGGMDVLMGRDISQEAAVIDLFEQAGFTTTRDGYFDDNNPHEIGLYARPQSDNEIIRNQEFAIEANVSMPKQFSALEMLETDEPIVAKDSTSNGGEDKYLLETRTQKAKFLSWALLGQHIIYLAYPDYHQIPKAEQIIQQVFEGNLNNTHFDKKNLANWQLEEHIVTPTKRNTSFRVLADIHGNIHYGLLNVSSNRIGQKYIQKWKHIKHPPLIEVNIPGTRHDLLLTHPKSPFYLNSRKITSNINTGGSCIMLNGEPVRNLLLRKILFAHNIDPDNPLIPEYLLEPSRIIGMLNRGDYPYVGLDFLLRASGGFVFLEANKNPALNAIALNLTKHATSADCVMEMMRRVIAHTS